MSGWWMVRPGKDTSFTVIAGLDPAIQTSPSNPLIHRRTANETSALLDRRVKPGDDGGAVAGSGQPNFEHKQNSLDRNRAKSRALG